MISDDRLQEMKPESGATGGRRKAVERGMVFGKWTVIGENPHKRRGKVLCRCVCGSEREVYVENLLTGRSQSCKCRIARPRTFINQLMVMGYPFIQPDQSRRLVVRCKCCICGKIVYPSVRDLLAGKSKACGCYRENLDCRARCELAKGAGDPAYHIPLSVPIEANPDDKVFQPTRKTPFSESLLSNHQRLVW